MKHDAKQVTKQGTKQVTLDEYLQKQVDEEFGGSIPFDFGSFMLRGMVGTPNPPDQERYYALKQKYGLFPTVMGQREHNLILEAELEQQKAERQRRKLEREQRTKRSNNQYARSPGA